VNLKQKKTVPDTCNVVLGETNRNWTKFTFKPNMTAVQGTQSDRLELAECNETL